MKALKFYCSVRCRVSSGSSNNLKVKQGMEDVVVGKLIKTTIVKNKVAAPYRKAEFEVYFDGRKINQADEIAAVALLRGLIPKYDSQGNISPTGRTYKLNAINKDTGEVEELIAKKKDDVAIELRNCPAVQAYLLDIIQNGLEDPEAQQFAQTEALSDLSDEEFEKKLLTGELDDVSEDDAEETSWGDL